MTHEVRHLFIGRHIAAQRGQGLGEGAHIHIHLVLQAEIAGSTAAAFAQHAQTVGVVHHHAGAVLFRQRADLRQLGNVTAHGKYAVGDDQRAVLLRHTLELLLQIRHVTVAVAQHLAVAHLTAGIDAGVILTVADHIIVHTHQRGNNAHIGLEAGTESDDTGLAQKPAQLLLQLQVHIQRAVQKTGTGAAGAVLFQCLDACFHDFRVDGQAQIVVGAQHDAALAFHHDLHILTGFQRMEIGIDPLLFQLIRQRMLITFFKNIHMFPS